MKSISLAVLLAASMSFVLGATVVSTTTCSAGDSLVPGGVSQSGTTSCSVNFPDPINAGSPSAKATASSMYTAPVTGNPAQDVSLQLSDSASAQGFARGFSTYALGTATESGNFMFATSGPVRPGHLVFYASAKVDFGGDPPFMNYVNLSIADINSSCTHGSGTSPASCTGSFGTINGVPPSQQTVNFTLGQTFTLHEDVYVDQFGGGSSGGSGSGLIGFSFHLTDLNGTPVQVYDVTAPEPATFFLAALALPLLLLTRKRTS